MHKVLVNRLVKLSEEKNVVRRTDSPDMTIAVDWDVKNQTKQTKKAMCIQTTPAFTIFLIL